MWHSTDLIQGSLTAYIMHIWLYVHQQKDTILKIKL
jgi:hypothetical protein